MKSLYQKFYTALAWNSLESLLYHGALLGHQLALFYSMGCNQYGTVGILFSYIYVSITLVNLGLDKSLSSFFYSATQSKKKIFSILLPQCMPTLFLCSTIFLFALFYKDYLCSSFYFLDNNTTLPLLISGIILTESIVKTTRLLLQISFKNKYTSAIQVISLYSYLAIVWILYFSGYALSPSLILTPLLICSTLSAVALTFLLARQLSRLPNSQAYDHEPSQQVIIKNRFYSYCMQLMHQCFSSNFLTPLFALHYGLAHAGFIKLISHGLQALSGVISSTFGPSLDAVLAHSKHQPINTRIDIFNTIKKLLSLSVSSIIFLTLLFLMSLPNPHNISHYNFYALYALTINLHFSQYFFMVFEKLYITHDKPHIIFYINGATALLLGLAYQYLYHSLIMMLVTATLIRIVGFIFLRLHTYYFLRAEKKHVQSSTLRAENPYLNASNKKTANLKKIRNYEQNA